MARRTAIRRSTVRKADHMEAMRIIAGYDPARPDEIDVMAVMVEWAARLPETTRTKLFTSAIEATAEQDKACHEALRRIFHRPRNTELVHSDELFAAEDRINGDLIRNDTMRRFFLAVIEKSADVRAAVN